MADPCLVRLTGVGFTYPGPPPVTALHPCDLSVGRGEYLMVTGPSGSGKSTLLNLLGMLDRPTAGRYEFDGVDAAGLNERDRTALRSRRIGFVFQSFHLLAGRTATENVALSLVYAGVPRRRRESIAREALDRVGLSHRRDAVPAHLSGGERQRVAIARALAVTPRLLLCDEPTGNLDSPTAAQILSLIEDLLGDDLTVIMITHDPGVAARGSRAVTIHDGVVR
jgi:putative ABC transport system ATP-binding protein